MMIDKDEEERKMKLQKERERIEMLNCKSKNIYKKNQYR